MYAVNNMERETAW